MRRLYMDYMDTRQSKYSARFETLFAKLSHIMFYYLQHKGFNFLTLLYFLYSLEFPLQLRILRFSVSIFIVCFYMYVSIWIIPILVFFWFFKFVCQSMTWFKVHLFCFILIYLFYFMYDINFLPTSKLILTPKKIN